MNSFCEEGELLVLHKFSAPSEHKSHNNEAKRTPINAASFILHWGKLMPLGCLLLYGGLLRSKKQLHGLRVRFVWCDILQRPRAFCSTQRGRSPPNLTLSSICSWCYGFCSTLPIKTGERKWKSRYLYNVTTNWDLTLHCCVIFSTLWGASKG